ncbi:MAG: hypothetical protein GYA61_08345 [Spirochaetales bacterium]|nr:hypothetical protein [Spirochaetales bacterium]
MSVNKELEKIKRENYIIELQNFENGFFEVIRSCGLPTENIFVPVIERFKVFKNINVVIEKLAENQRSNSLYLSKFLAATASGLFDAALNYLWDETILEIRKRVIQYDVIYFYNNTPISEEKKNKLKNEDDIVKLDDNELIQGARNIGLISELGYKHLDYIRYMRNWASAAHPNQNQLTGLQLITWLETCIKEVISLPISTIAIEIKQLLANIKTNTISGKDARNISKFFINLTQNQINNLASGFLGNYTDLNITPQCRQNINLLLPYIWDRVDEETKQSFGIKYGKFVANNDKDRALFTKQFLQIVNGLSYIPDDLKVAEIETAIQNLLTAHRGGNNFYNEPIFARQLTSIIGQSGNVPSQIKRLYVLSLTEVYITNGNGVAWNAEPYYISLFKQFDQNETIIFITSFTNERISSRLQFDLCRKKFIELLNILKGNITIPAIKELIDSIDNFKGSLDMLKNDSRIIQQLKSVQVILGS